MPYSPLRSPGLRETWAEVHEDDVVIRKSHVVDIRGQKRDRERVIISVLGSYTSANGMLCPVLVPIVQKRCE